MERLRLAASCALSLTVHFALLVLAESWIVISSSSDRLGQGGALLVDLVPGGDRRTAVPERSAGPPIPHPAPPPPPQPIARRPPLPQKVAKMVPRSIDGVRVATADDIRRHAEKEQAKPALAPASAPPPPQTDTVRNETPSAVGPGAPSIGPAATPEGNAPVTVADDKPHRGLFRADTPGFNGRIFGQISVASSAAKDSFYGRIHLFREDAVYRDYSDKSLFGYSFRERLGEVALREFEVGRVTTSGAYLAVTDLFPDGHLSTMSHTVVFAFPRRAAPGASRLYDVVEEPNGVFRLRGPGGSLLRFDGRTGALGEAAGFVVSPQGESGTPPRIRYRGLHVRLESVGSNPFLRDRRATVVDAARQECELSTSDLFSYAGRAESDVFRFPDDSALFAFLRSRCSWLGLPEPAPVETRVARARPEPEKKPERPRNEGLLPLLLRGFR